MPKRILGGEQMISPTHITPNLGALPEITDLEFAA